jgi:tetratricopeptide (TPR) repeat protein
VLVGAVLSVHQSRRFLTENKNQQTTTRIPASALEGLTTLLSSLFISLLLVMVHTEQYNPQAGAGRPLPKKEQDIFRSLLKHYEMKQYKKAIKQADLILKKFPKHGETLAMKGLTLNNMSKKDEAHSLVKEGLMNDMR